MKCVSCQQEINPQWSHAIDANLCPFCGKEIMEEVLKNLFATLKTTMESLSTYPDQLNDWMLSNYKYIKTDSKEFAKYLPKKVAKVVDDSENVEDSPNKYIDTIETEDGEQKVIVEKIQSEETTNDFFKRAEAVKPNIDGFRSSTEKNKHLKDMVKQIKRSGSTDAGGSGGSFLSPENLESADPAAVEEYMSILDSGNAIASSLPDLGGGGDDDIPAAVLAMAAKGGTGPATARDMMKLQQMQLRQTSSRENFESGANRGKGGFSRSG